MCVYYTICHGEYKQCLGQKFSTFSLQHNIKTIFYTSRTAGLGNTINAEAISETLGITGMPLTLFSKLVQVADIKTKLLLKNFRLDLYWDV